MATMNKTDAKLLAVAWKLVQEVNKSAEEGLPQRLVDIVKLHSGLAVGAALVPIPGADALAAIGNIWTMYVRINNELEIPFNENAIKSVASGVATNLGAAYCASLTLGIAFKFIPGFGTLAGALLICSTIYAVTMASGFVYMKALTVLHELEGEGTGRPPAREQDIQSAVQSVLKDEQFVKETVENARADYKVSGGTSLTKGELLLWVRDAREAGTTHQTILVRRGDERESCHEIIAEAWRGSTVLKSARWGPVSPAPCLEEFLKACPHEVDGKSTRYWIPLGSGV